jgi:hypothetical protein
VDVSLDDVRLCLWRFWLPPEFILPLCDVLQFVEEEDALALTLSDWLHNPDLVRSFEFFDEKGVVARQIVGGWEEVVTVGLVLLTFSLKLLFVSF